jgi:uncharacterized metal-binding protein
MSDTTLVLACSGGSDVGELADRTARALKAAGTAKMYCLAGIGGQLPSMVKTARAADTLLAIDGCPQNCAAQCLKNAGIETFRHLKLAELGFEKGKTPVTDEALVRTTGEARRVLESNLAVPPEN